ncbi:cytochrome P460 family protein [Desulfocurvibacter africanus]|uniref:Cytochrome P460 domain-containing protein n=1 Tax=Desulfocurvibacter africanus subsp. africanus str. Walvis Bay TaxID=690850 RepID=F3YUJ4_DESAF|nr:cytochrome P460 family protein [Desulfocurvibacter africanus]EGJ48948.1 hypothetical protein Desaf_0595 [Desulfocurvibacter africanus subsp. africanus str. Walvis Bay]
MRGMCFMLLAGLAVLAAPILGSAAQEASTLPQAEAKAVYTYMTKTSSYQQWGLWPGKDKLYQGTQPHGALLTTYVNELAAKALKDHKQAQGLPDGSMIVKENYSPDKKLMAVTAMYKKQGFAPQSGDWFWIKWMPDGKIEAAGEVGDCLKCHEQAKGSDYLFTAAKAGH